jgi:hypothetical protein
MERGGVASDAYLGMNRLFRCQLQLQVQQRTPPPNYGIKHRA